MKTCTIQFYNGNRVEVDSVDSSTFAVARVHEFVVIRLSRLSGDVVDELWYNSSTVYSVVITEDASPRIRVLPE